MTTSPATQTPQPTAAGAPTAPLVAIIANVLTPYRLHVHRRIAREMPEIRLASIFTHDQPDQPWDLPDLPEINPVRFGNGDPVNSQGRTRYLVREWTKGGRIIRWLDEHRAAAILIGGYNDLGRLRIIRRAHASNTPVFVYADSNIEGDRAKGVRRVLKNALVKGVVDRCTGVMPYGTLGEKYFLRYGAQPAQIFYWPCEPDYDQITRLTAVQVTEILARYHLDPSRRRIIVCSRLMPHKRVDLVVQAFQRIAERQPEWDLVIVGDGPDRVALERSVSPGLRGRVIFTGFVGNQLDIAGLYRASQILAHPSAWEPWGVVINEAVAAGMAVIASSVTGAAADLVRDGVNGFLFPSGNATALADALQRAATPENLSRLRAASAGVLKSWRERADPVRQLRSALQFAHIVSE